MPWAKFDDGMGEHRKTRRAIRAGGYGAFGLHALAILHASRYLTDGFVEDEYVEEMDDLTRTKPRERQRIVSALEGQGLWVPDEGGWRIHGYLDHNPSRSDVERRRRADADRKAAGRASQSQTGPEDVRLDTLRMARGREKESGRPVPSRPNPSSLKGSRTTDRGRSPESENFTDQVSSHERGAA